MNRAVALLLAAALCGCGDSPSEPGEPSTAHDGTPTNAAPPLAREQGTAHDGAPTDAAPPHAAEPGSARDDAPTGAAPVRPRNVLLFVVDTLRADRLGCYGYARDTSPQLDALAARGTRYLGCRAQSTWTVPSMISLMSGLYVSDEEERLPADQPTLAERLREAGLRTAAFLGNPVLSAGRGFARGFDHFEGPIGGGRAADVVARFATWLADGDSAADDARGFFAWLHVTDPHTPYDPDIRYRVFGDQPLPDEPLLRARWESWSAELVPAEGHAPGDVAAGPVASPAHHAVADEAASARLDREQALAAMRAEHDLYDAEVRQVDAALGRLLAFLDASGERERTLIVFASDHGEELYEHRKYAEDLAIWRRQSPSGMGQDVKDHLEWAHGSCFHDEVWEVPLVLAGPGVPAGQVRDGLAANLDVLPTVLAAITGSAPVGLPGEVLLGGARPTREQVFGYSRRAAAVLDASGLKLVDRRRKRALYPEWALGPGDHATSLELFDLSHDPAELVDRAAARPAKVDALRDVIDAWFRATAREVDTVLSEADRQALREMGYLR